MSNLKISFYDSSGNHIESFVSTPAGAMRRIHDFLLYHGLDPEEGGKDAMEGTIAFEPTDDPATPDRETAEAGDVATVGDVRLAIAGLPDAAPVQPTWKDGPPSDSEPAVAVHGFRAGGPPDDPRLEVDVSLHYLEGDDEDDEDEDDEDNAAREGTPLGRTHLLDSSRAVKDRTRDFACAAGEAAGHQLSDEGREDFEARRRRGRDLVNGVAYDCWAALLAISEGLQGEDD